jgi:hypothetical protein
MLLLLLLLLRQVLLLLLLLLLLVLLAAARAVLLRASCCSCCSRRVAARVVLLRAQCQTTWLKGFTTLPINAQRHTCHIFHIQRTSIVYIRKVYALRNACHSWRNCAPWRIPNSSRQLALLCPAPTISDSTDRRFYRPMVPSTR